MLDFNLLKWYPFLSDLGRTQVKLPLFGAKFWQLRLFERARELKLEDPVSWSQVGVALGELGRLEESLAAFEEAERLVPTKDYVAQAALLAQLTNNRGITLRRLERYAEAVAAYRQSVQLTPDDADVWYNLALACWQWPREARLAAGQRAALLEEALTSSEQALAIEPHAIRAQKLREHILADLRLVKGERTKGW